MQNCAVSVASRYTRLRALVVWRELSSLALQDFIFSE